MLVFTPAQCRCRRGLRGRRARRGNRPIFNLGGLLFALLGAHPWPRSPDYPYNFRYFMSGYKRRNRAIAAAFRRYPARIAVVTDIRRFYPSIRHDLLRDRFYSALDQSDVAVPVRDTAGMLLHHITAHFKGRGIATGPEFSRTLPNVLLG